MQINCTYTYRDKTYSRDRLLRVLAEENPQFSIRSLQSEIDWLKDYLGMSEKDVTVVRGLIDNKSLGRLKEDGNILLSEYADIKDVKHEAFHRVWRLYLSDSERSDALRAFKSTKNWRDKIEYLREAYKNHTENEIIEEHFAREFEDFTLNPEEYSIIQPIKSFFSRILNFLKRLLNLSPADVSVIYRNIYSGKYKAANKTSTYTTKIDKVIVSGKEVAVEEKNEIVNSAVQQILSQVIKSPQGLDAFIRSENMDNFKQSIGLTFQNIVNHVSKRNPELASVIIEDLDNYFVKGKNSFFVTEIKNKISQLGISVVEIENDEDSTASENDVSVNQRREFTSNIEIDPKTNMSRKVKILLASFKDENKKTPVLGLDMPVQWSQAFLRIAEKMAGVPTSDFVEVISNANLPFQKQLNEFMNSPSFNYMGNDFISSMSNTINNFNVMQFKDGDIYFFDANVNTKADKLKREWHNALVKSINDAGSFEGWVKMLKSYNKDARTTVEEISSLIGISLSGDATADMNDSVIQIARQIEAEIRGKGFTESNKPDFTKLFSKNNFDVEGRVSALAQQESSNRESVDMMTFIISKKLYSLGLNTHQTHLVNSLNYAVSKFTEEMSLEDKIEILRKYAPFAVTEFNVTKVNGEYVIRNKWLAKILDGNKLKINIIYAAQTDLADESEVAKLDETDLMTLHINGALQGMNMSMKHSDRSTFFAYSFDDRSPLFGTDLMKSESAALDILTESIVDQINLEVDIANKFDSDFQAFQHFAKKYKNAGFAEILGQDRFDQLVKGDSIDYRDKMKIKNFIKDVFEEFVNSAEMLEAGISKTSMAMFGNNKRLALASAFVNEIAGHLEEVKLFMGDLRFYKDSVDLFKRLAAMSSTGKMLVNDTKTNDRVRAALTKEPIQILNPITGKEEEFVYNLAPDGYFRAITLAENEEYSSFLTEPGEIKSKLTGNNESKLFLMYEYNMLADLGREATEAEKKQIIEDIRNYEAKYKKVNENDGQSYMTIVAFKNYMMRLGLWNPAFENVYRTEMQILKAKSFEDVANITFELGGFNIKPFEINKGDSFGERKLKVNDKLFTIGFSPLHTLKTQYSGYSVSEEYFKASQELAFMANSIFKTSQHILLPSAVIGTNLQTMNHTMLSNGIDIVHMGSANKVGGIDPKIAASNFLGREEAKERQHVETIAKKGLQFYDDSGHFNYAAINENIDIISYLGSYDYLKDQVAIGNKVKDVIKGSTQSLKILLTNLIVNGKERFPGAQEIVNEYKRIIKDMVNKNLSSFLEEIGYDKTTDEFTSMSAFRDALLNSQAAKTAPENILNAIENFIEDPKFETVPGSNKIENILYAMFTNSVISFDRPGNAYPQAAVTGYEPIGKRNISATNQDTLKFYEPVFDSDGNLVKINPAEIILPLPDYWVESILTKYNTRNLVVAISKLNADIEAGKVRNQVTFKGLRIPNQQLSSNDVFTVKRFTLPTMQSYVIVPSELVVKVGSDFDIDKLNIYWSNETEKTLFHTSVEERYQNYKKAAEEVSEEVMSFEHFSSLIKSSLDTKLLEIEKQILLHPRNAHHLFMPIVDDIFSKKVYDEMSRLGTIAEEKKGLFYSVSPHVNVAKSVIFTKGKSGVGAVALDITGHATSQVDVVEIEQTAINSSGDRYSTMLRFDGMQNNYALGNYTNEDNKFISEILSQLLTTQVDNVKDPKAVKMNITMQTLGIVGYLTRRGVGTAKIIKFINQPIIKEYLTAQIVNESLTNKAAKQEINKTKLIKGLLNKYNLQLENLPEDWTFTEEDLNNGLSGKMDLFQTRILAYFLDLVEQTKSFSTYSSYQNADTKGLKNREGVEDVFMRAISITSSGLINPKTVARVNTEGVISPFTQARNMYDDLYSRFYFTVSSPYYGPLFQFKSVMSSLQKTANRKEKVRKQVEEDFVLFFIHNYVLNEPALIDRLFGKNGNKSVAEKVREAQEKMPDNMVLKAFFPMLRSSVDPLDGEFIDNLRLFERELLTIDTNDLINSMRELGEIDPELYYDLIHLLFFQSGISNSPYNYFKIIPVARNKSNSPLYEFVYKEILDQAIIAAERLVQSVDQASEIVANFANLFQLNNPQYLRKRSYYGYPLQYTVSYVKGKPVIIDVESGDVVKGLGSSSIKRYNINQLGIEKSEDNFNSSLLQDLYKNFVKTNTIYEGSDILPFIGESEYYKELVSGLLKFNRNMRFMFYNSRYEYSLDMIEDYELATDKKTTLEEKVNFMSDAGIAGYSRRVNKAYFSPEAVQKSLIHELVHATIQEEYIKGGEFKTKIDMLYEYADSYHFTNISKESTPYGFTSPTEFLAEALSDPEFMQILNEIPYNDGKSVWTYFMELVSKFINSILGVEFKRGSVLEQVVRLSEQVINNKNEVSKHTSVSEFTVGSEVLDNFETYFPQFTYFNQEQRNAVARLVEEGKIQLKCEF